MLRYHFQDWDGCLLQHRVDIFLAVSGLARRSRQNHSEHGRENILAIAMRPPKSLEPS